VATPLAVAGVVLAGLGGAALLAVLGSFDLGPGMLAVAAFMGWVAGLAVVWVTAGSGRTSPGARMAIAGCVAVLSILGGYAALWAWSRIEGGVLDPVGYLDARFGLLAVLLLLVGAAVAVIRAR
jgi:hypothetical protein